MSHPNGHRIIEMVDPDILEKAENYYKEELCQRAFAPAKIRLARDGYTDKELEEYRCVADVIEMSLIEALRKDDKDSVLELSSKAFYSLRIAEGPSEWSPEAARHLLKTACFGIIGGRSADVGMWLREIDLLGSFEIHPESWAERVWIGAVQAFLLLARKDRWEDFEVASKIVANLRAAQKEYEKEYLKSMHECAPIAAGELASLYHIAKTIDLLAAFFRDGSSPEKKREDINFHLDKSYEAASALGVSELPLSVLYLRYAVNEMVESSVWWVLTATNHHITKFVRRLASKEMDRPILELWPSQREALLKQGLLDAVKRALVIQMPTSSGKTLLAEFVFLQTKSLFPSAWVAYIVPTRALTNQIWSRLRKDLGPLGFRVEKAVPAFQLDPLEEELLLQSEGFDLLVTTQEKLDLLIRSGKLKNTEERHLGLVILDEAHAIAENGRGLRTELLLATINREFENVHFLLLSPFVPNVDELADWLDGEKSARISVNWRPNQQIVGLVNPIGTDEDWNLRFKSLFTSSNTMHIDEDLEFEKYNPFDKKKRKLTKMDISVAAAKSLSKRKGGVIVVSFKKNYASTIAETLHDLSDERSAVSENVALVLRYIATEFGRDYQPYRLVGRGIGIHHAGIFNELRYLQEWLMEKHEIDIMVASSTIAQGVNFPISSIIINDYHLGRDPPKPLPPNAFWNIAGRAGRAYQDVIGLVAFSSKDETDPKLERYLNQQMSNLVSHMEKIVSDVYKVGSALNFSEIIRNHPEWSSFIQYLCHAYRQIDDHSRFLAETEKIMRATFGFQRIMKNDPVMAHSILDATRSYAEEIRKIDKKTMSLVDQTGFSPDSIIDLRRNARDLGKLRLDEWSPSGLFQGGSAHLADMVGSLLKVTELPIPSLGRGDQRKVLSEILTHWVNGLPMGQIAKNEYYASTTEEKSLNDCVKHVTLLAESVSWGMGALGALMIRQNDVENLSPRNRLEIRSVPAMIYFGVPTIEGVVMRNLGVPRSIAHPLGDLYHEHEEKDIPSISSAKKWLESVDEAVWEKCRPAGGELDGGDYQRIWRLVNGDDLE